MKKFLFLILVPLFLTVIFMVNGCKLDNPSNTHYTEFVIQIDSITHPNTVKLGSSLQIKFYGTIGPDGCYSFSRFDGGVEGKTINVTVYGRKSDEDVCTQQVQYLSGATLNVNQLDTGRYILHVHQPFPPDLTDTVFVSGLNELK